MIDTFVGHEIVCLPVDGMIDTFVGADIAKYPPGG